MTRPITPHKGGRTARAPEARMTPQERSRLNAVLKQRGVKHTDWYIGHVNADYAEITGNDTMTIWLREKDCEGYQLRIVDSLDGLVYDETGEDGIPCYHEE